MKTYILGLQSHFRGNALIRELSPLDLDIEIQWGVDAQIEDSQNVLLNSRLRSNLVGQILFQKRVLSPGELACYLGHFQIWSRFLETREKCMLVLEDDAKLQNIEFLNALKLREFGRATIILLNEAPIRDGYPTLDRYVKNSSQNDESLMLRVPFSGSYAYYMNRSAAHAAIQATMRIGIISTIDWPPYFSAVIDFRSSRKPIFSHNDSQKSLIGHDNKVVLDKYQTSSRVAIKDSLEYFLGITPLRLKLAAGVPFFAMYKYGILQINKRFRMLKNHFCKTGSESD